MGMTRVESETENAKAAILSCDPLLSTNLPLAPLAILCFVSDDNFHCDHMFIDNVHTMSIGRFGGACF